MSSSQLVQRNEGSWNLEGDVTLATVPELYRAGGALWQKAGMVVVDMAPVGRIDSSSIALMLAWMREARAAGVELRFGNIPPQVMAVARLCGVAALLPA